MNDLFLKGGDRAILLLHGFGSNIKNLTTVAHNLNSYNYTVLLPHYTTGKNNLEGLYQINMDDWYNEVILSYRFLKEKGYDVSVIGHSLGGVLALRLASKYILKGIGTINSPIMLEPERLLKVYKDTNIEEAFRSPVDKSKSLKLYFRIRDFINDTKKSLKKIKEPVFLAQGTNDELIGKENAEIIYNELSSIKKELKFYNFNSHFLGDEEYKAIYDIIGFIYKN